MTVACRTTAAGSCLPCHSSLLSIRSEQENRLEGVRFEPRPQIGKEEPHRGEEPLDADLGHRKRSEGEAAGLHGLWIGWDDGPHILALQPTQGLVVVDGVKNAPQPESREPQESPSWHCLLVRALLVIVFERMKNQTIS